MIEGIISNYIMQHVLRVHKKLIISLLFTDQSTKNIHHLTCKIIKVCSSYHKLIYLQGYDKRYLKFDGCSRHN